MHTSVALLLELGAILAALSVLGALARRFALSPVPLYLLAGVALGEGGIAPVPAAGEFVRIGASIGVVLLLLTLGLEFTIREFTVSLRRHLPSAVADVVLNAAPGALAGWLLGLNPAGILALAGVTYVSSSGIIARLLSDMRRLGNRETPAVLSVLVLEDFAMAAYLPVLAAVVSGRTWHDALLGVAVALGAVALAILASHRWGHHLGRLVSHPDAEQLLLRLMGITLVVAALAESVQVSAAVGAFLVGLALAGEAADRARAVLTPLRDFFAAAFFLAIGLSVGFAALLPALPIALALAAVTAATKVATGWHAASRDRIGLPGRLRAGTALIARGEFSIIIAALAGSQVPGLAPLVAAYVLILAIAGPLITRFAALPRPAARTVSRSANPLSR